MPDPGTFIPSTLPVTVHSDGRVEVAEGLRFDEAARLFWIEVQKLAGDPRVVHCLPEIVVTSQILQIRGPGTVLQSWLDEPTRLALADAFVDAADKLRGL